jgi:hypothetical protein
MMRKTICGLFNYGVSSSDCMASNDRITNEKSVLPCKADTFYFNQVLHIEYLTHL